MDKKLILPREGQNLHDAVLKYSRELLVDGYEVNDVVNILLEAGSESNRTTQDFKNEIENAVRGASEFLTENPGWKRNRIDINTWKDPLSFLGNGDGMCRNDKRNISTTKVDYSLVDRAFHSKRIELINAKFSFAILFARINFKICASRDKYSGPVKKLNDWNLEEFAKMQYIVPNYFWKTSEEGGDKSDYNIGRRLFLVVEFDRSSTDSQLSLLSFLHSNDFKLVMIVFSGHRSLHGWFTSYGRSEYKVVSFCIRAKQLGADKMTYSPSQYCRMPGGWNSKYKRIQEIIHFDPLAIRWQNDTVREDLL